MADTRKPDRDHVVPDLAPDESVRAIVRTTDARLVVTDRRIAVADETRVALDVPLTAVRRIQFDIERRRPATFVIVPDEPQHEPQVLAIPPESYQTVGELLAFIGTALYGGDSATG
jgi:hypothetical protein